jgi:hypothetical protein
MSADTRSRLGAGLLSLVAGLASGGLVWSLMTLAASVAVAQDGAAPPVDPLGTWLEAQGFAGWQGSALRWGFTILALTAVIEAVRWGVPGFERGVRDAAGNAVKLPPQRRWVLLGLVLVGGQAAAWGKIIDPPWGLPVATAFAGIIAGVASAVFNEAIWKRIAKFLQDRLGFEPPRVKRKRAELAGMTTGQFRALRDGEEPPAP